MARGMAQGVPAGQFETILPLNKTKEPRMNELLLVATLVLCYGAVALAYRFFGREGLIATSVLVTILANIEVLIVVDAFGMEMTLGNVLFACTFLITDILSENHGRASANKAVVVSTCAAVFFAILSQLWLLYVPSDASWALPSFHTLFANTPRLIVASLLVYFISQTFDVWLYHTWWRLTTKAFGDKRRGMWIRNNGSTLISQLVNSVLYNVLAFAGMYDATTLLHIVLSTYVIYIFTSLLDTPIAYLCRRMHERGLVPATADSSAEQANGTSPAASDASKNADQPADER